MNLSQMTIKAKLTAGFGVLAAIVVVVSGMSLHALSNSTEGFSNFVHGINARAAVATEVRTAVDRRAIAARNLVLVVTQQDLELEKAEVFRAHEDVQKQLKLLKEMIANAKDATDRGRALLDPQRGPRLRPSFAWDFRRKALHPAMNFSRDEHMPKDQRYRRAREYARILTKKQIDQIREVMTNGTD